MKKWTKQLVIQELEALHRRGAPLSYNEIFKSNRRLHTAALKLFPSYAEALRQAGIEYTKVRQKIAWDKPTILRELKKLHEPGADLSGRNINQMHGALYGAAVRHFSSYRAAALAAGIDIDKFQRLRRWDKPTIIRELQELHRRGGNLSRIVMKRENPRLLDAAIRYFGSYREALGEAGIDYATVQPKRVKCGTVPQWRNYWNASLIVRELKSRHSRGGDLSATGLRRDNSALYSAAIKYFPSYSKALEAAGIDCAGVWRIKSWDKAKVLRELQARHDRGASLTPNDVRTEDIRLLAAACRNYGTYRQALESAGINYRSRSMHRWDKTTVIRELQERDAAGKDLSSVGMLAERGALFGAATKYFGTYEKALAAAGIDYTKARRVRRWSKEMVLELISREHRAGLDISWDQILLRHGGLPSTAKHHFGTYEAAVKAAGIDYKQVRRNIAWNKEMILTQLVDLDRRGKDLRNNEIQRTSPKLIDACRTHFGSYRKAMEAADLDYPPKKPLAFWTRKKVLATLQQLHGEGVDLRYDSFKKTHQALFAAARYYYGKYHRAVTTAGIDYSAMLRSYRKSPP